MNSYRTRHTKTMTEALLPTVDEIMHCRRRTAMGVSEARLHLMRERALAVLEEKCTVSDLRELLRLALQERLI